jgi:hypothetical protein
MKFIDDKDTKYFESEKSHEIVQRIKSFVNRHN